MDGDDFSAHGYDHRCPVCGEITDSGYCSNECFERGQEDADAVADAEIIELELMWRE